MRTNGVQRTSPRADLPSGSIGNSNYASNLSSHTLALSICLISYEPQTGVILGKAGNRASVRTLCLRGGSPRHREVTPM